VYWDADTRKDLLIGRADGTINLYTNIGTDAEPTFDAGVLLEVGEPGSKVAIDVGSRATPVVVDWNSDSRKDLVIGGIDGRIHVFLNEGLDTLPDFRSETFAQDDGGDLVVPSVRSSPEVFDIDQDGKKDLLLGNTNGQLLFYSNVSSDAAPSFSGYVAVEADSVPIDLSGTPRSRPGLCDWTGDGELDVLLGASDGLVRLYQGLEHTHWAGIPGGEAADESALLLAAHPNPFTPRTSIPVVLRKGGSVRIAVHDVAGREVAVLADRRFGPGVHEVTWRGVDETGRQVPSGIYFVRLVADGSSATRKVVLLR
jgi:hypothetical protein